jgi:transposase
VFTERLPGICVPHARQTARCIDVMQRVGYALGGRGGERLLGCLGVAVSDDTVVRGVKRRAQVPQSARLRVVGIDDWAWQKGQQHFGTILVDLERHAVVDVLGVRTADAVASWLVEHPDIRIISRDRHGPYAEGVRRGAPQAKEVADRFHLVMNLRGAVQQELSRLRRFLAVPDGAVVAPAKPGRRAAITASRRRPPAVVAYQKSIAHERWALQLERFHRVKALQASGRSAGAIMRETGLGRAYVRKWVYLSELPPRNRMAPRSGMPDFYLAYLRRRWTEGCQSGRLLLAEVQTLGYVGCYSGLAKLLAPWREPESAARDTLMATAVANSRHQVQPAVRVRHISPQVAAALLGQPRTLLSVRQAKTLEVLQRQCPGFTRMRRLVLSFRAILRQGKVATLRRWMTRTLASNIHALQRFVRTLRQDLSAVEGAVSERWSNGPVEGHINRLKMLRRQMYGRAGVELLRARTMPFASAHPVSVTR